MKPRLSLISFVIIVLATSVLGFGQAGCDFKIAGDWESTAPGQAASHLYRFGPDGIVTAFSSGDNGLKKLGKAAYKLDIQQTSKTLEFRHVPGAGAFPWSAGKLGIDRIDPASFVVVNSGVKTTWVKKDPYRYFVVLAAHRGTPPHKGGPAFAMLIKTSDAKTEAETFGLFYRDGERILGPIADNLYKEFTSDPVSKEDALLRLQISQQAFDKALKVMRSWQERAHGGALLFPQYSYLNIVVPFKEIAESLDQCGENFHLYKLTWLVDDELGANVPEWELAFQYVRKLRELNEQSHVTDAKFQQSITSRLVLPLSKN